jgi:hypothetical protein
MDSDAMSSTRPAVPTSRVVCVPSVDLRARPDHGAECVSESLMGSRLVVQGQRENFRWLRVIAPDGYMAWTLRWGTSDPHPLYEAGRGVFVTVPHALLRATPAPESPTVTPLWMGCGLSLTGRKRGRSREAATPDGRSGWIDVGSLEAEDRPALAGFWDPPLRAPRFGAPPKRVCARALALLGTPYRWGGTSPGGFDCSGFVRLVLGLEGVVLPRDAKDQESALSDRRVDRLPARLRAGEIVFFGPRRGRADHVGLGIGGMAGRLIHASGRVRIAGLNPKDSLFDADLARQVRSIARP